MSQQVLLISHDFFVVSAGPRDMERDMIDIDPGSIPVLSDKIDVEDDRAARALQQGDLGAVATYLADIVIPFVRDRDRRGPHQTDTLWMLVEAMRHRPGLEGAKKRDL